jgi:hypothetical protein
MQPSSFVKAEAEAGVFECCAVGHLGPRTISEVPHNTFALQVHVLL